MSDNNQEINDEFQKYFGGISTFFDTTFFENVKTEVNKLLIEQNIDTLDSAGMITLMNRLWSNSGFVNKELSKIEQDNIKLTTLTSILSFKADKLDTLSIEQQESIYPQFISFFNELQKAIDIFSNAQDIIKMQSSIALNEPIIPYWPKNKTQLESLAIQLHKQSYISSSDEFINAVLNSGQTKCNWLKSQRQVCILFYLIYDRKPIFNNENIFKIISQLILINGKACTAKQLRSNVYSKSENIEDFLKEPKYSEIQDIFSKNIC